MVFSITLPSYPGFGQFDGFQSIPSIGTGTGKCLLLIIDPAVPIMIFILSRSPAALMASGAASVLLPLIDPLFA